MSRLPYFALLTFFAAFSIEAIGTVVSVIGLSTLFGANPIIMTLAVALDVGKLVVVALLYKYWGELNRVMRAYGLMAAIVTMTITSAGAAGYLSGEFQKAIIGTQEGQLKVQVLKEEQTKLEARKKQIDDSIAAIPDKYTANQKIRLMNQFKAEQKTVTDRLAQISQELPQVQISQISTEAKAGPILYIAKAFNITVEEAVRWVILMIIFVFDPLAVFLIIAGNFLVDQRRAQRSLTPPPVLPPEPLPPPPAPEPLPPPPAPEPPAPLVDDAPAAREPSDEPEHHGPVARTHQEHPEDYIRPPVEDEPEHHGPVARTHQEHPDDHIRPPIEEPQPVVIEVEESVQPLAAPPDDLVPQRPPSPSDGETVPLQSEREVITRSSLGLVKPDSGTQIAATGDTSLRAGIYRSGGQSK